MMFDVSQLRDVNERKQFEGKRGYVKWWAARSELDSILDKIDIKYNDMKDILEVKDDLYCIYIGKPNSRLLPPYLRQEINGKHTKMVDGVFTFRTSIPLLKRYISSIFFKNQAFEDETNEFLDKLKIEVIVIDDLDETQDIKEEINNRVNELFEKNFYIFNKNFEHFPKMSPIADTLSTLREESKLNAEEYCLSKNEILDNSNEKDLENSNIKRNVIYFGAPGTGKSYNLNKDKYYLLKGFEDNYERVTFHPDFSYANFVGTYKPVPKNKSITYKYVPGPFMRILSKALNNPDEPYLLIIEEINRANVAAVFGDVFQLLDRNENNDSEYPINTSEDMKKFLNDELNKDFDEIIIPQNMFIWATMNSADQGVFAMDTAFKRRWDFKYFSINHNEKLTENIKVNINGQEIVWNELRKAINEELLTYKINEDKLLGPFFAFNEYQNKQISESEFKEIFKNKIIMYLFEDAAKSRRNELFSGVAKNTNLTYSQICEDFDKNGIEIFTDSIKENFIKDDGE